MEEFDEYLRQRARQEPIPIPEDYHGKIFAVCAGLEERQEKEKRPRRVRLEWVAAVLALVIAIPNLSPAAAAAMADIPVLGSLVEIITFRKYAYDDGHSSEDVQVPELGGSPAAEEVSREVEAYTAQIMERFEEERKTLGEGYQNLTVTSQVVTDSDDWFTLRIDASEVRASGYAYSRFYHIDKRTGSIVTLGDLFAKDSDYGRVLADEVIRQMKTRTDHSYAPESMESVEADQNFYWNEQGELVLIFDEYEIAAGAEGMPEFTIPAEVLEPLLRQ